MTQLYLFDRSSFVEKFTRTGSSIVPPACISNGAPKCLWRAMGAA